MYSFLLSCDVVDGKILPLPYQCNNLKTLHLRCFQKRCGWRLQEVLPRAEIKHPSLSTNLHDRRTQEKNFQPHPIRRASDYFPTKSTMNVGLGHPEQNLGIRRCIHARFGDSESVSPGRVISSLRGSLLFLVLIHPR